jgi:hypothetical protein
MNRYDVFSRLALTLGVALLGWAVPHQGPRAHVPAPADPSFDVLLKAQPIVVLARVGDMVGTSKKAFEAIAGDADSSPAFTEEYHQYRLRRVRLLKGELPEVFDLRVINGSRNHILLDRAWGQELLLILAPDSGLDPQGRLRDTFLITHGAAYPVRNGRFQVPGEQGPETWSVEQSAQAIDRFRQEQERRRADSPEPRDADAAVFAGEEAPGRIEQDPPEGPKLRSRGPLLPDALIRAAPKAMEGPGGDEKAARPRN